MLLAGRLFSVALNFGIQVLIVRYLAKADYGAFAYASAVMMVASHIVALGLNKGLSRFVPIYQERRHYDKMAGTIALVICTIVIFGASLAMLIFGLAGAIGEHFFPDPLALSLLLILIWVAPIEALNDITAKLFAIFAGPRAVFFRRHILTPGFRLAAVLAVVFFEGDAVFLAVAYLVAGILGLVISLLIIAQILRKQNLLGYFRHENIILPARGVFRFSIPLLSSDVVTALRGTLVVFFLGFFHSSVSVAAFRSVLSVARLNGMVADSFKFLFEPMAGRMYARDDRAGINELYWRTASWIVVFTFPIFALSFALSKPLVVLFFGERYADSGVVLTVLAIGSFVNAAFGFNGLTLRIFKKVRAIVAIDFVVVLLAILLNLLLIPQLGAIGGAIASSGVLVAQNIFYQAMLVRIGAVKPFNILFLKVMSTVILVAVTLFLIQYRFELPIYAGLSMAVVASLLVLWLTGPSLNVETAFPELRRYAATRWLLRIPREPAVSG